MVSAIYKIASVNGVLAFSTAAFLSVLIAFCTIWLFRLQPLSGSGGVYKNDVFIGHSFAVIGVFLALVVAFTIVISRDEFTLADDTLLDEISQIKELRRDIEQFDEVTATKLDKAISDYVVSVATNEFIHLDKYGTVHPATLAFYNALWAEVYAISPRPNTNDDTFLNLVLDRMNEISKTRTLRTLRSSGNISSSLWSVLVVSMLFLVIIGSMFSVENILIHLICLSFITFVVMAELLVIVRLQYPFSGDVKVNISAYKSFAAEVKAAVDAEV